MKTICHTNLDGYRDKAWPTQMENPQVGHLVKALTGEKLKIVQITHCERNVKHGRGVGFIVSIESYLEIELHK